jgi:CRP-like cAMP-binding protein
LPHKQHIFSGNELLQLLKSVPFLAPLTVSELDHIAQQSSTEIAAPGHVIVREGEVGDRMYVIARGAVQILTTSFDGSDVVLARLEAGQWFGEHAAWRHRPPQCQRPGA